MSAGRSELWPWSRGVLTSAPPCDSLVLAPGGPSEGTSKFYFPSDFCPMRCPGPRTFLDFSCSIPTTVSEVNTLIVPILPKRKWAQESLG